MLHHVSIEVHPDDVADCIEAWELLGFTKLEPPAEISKYVSWLEREGTQIHLIHSEGPVVPPLGHAAVAVDDFDNTFESLQKAGMNPERHQELWGEPRGFVVLPGGHRVELMGAPPPPSV